MKNALEISTCEIISQVSIRWLDSR